MPSRDDANKIYDDMAAWADSQVSDGDKYDQGCRDTRAVLMPEIERLRAALRQIAEWKDNNIWPAEETRDAMREFATYTLNEQPTVRHVPGCKALFTKDDNDCDLCGREQTTVTLPAKDYEKFVEALDSPPEPGEKLKDLMRREPPWDT